MSLKKHSYATAPALNDSCCVVVVNMLERPTLLVSSLDESEREQEGE